MVTNNEQNGIFNMGVEGEWVISSREANLWYQIRNIVSVGYVFTDINMVILQLKYDITLSIPDVLFMYTNLIDEKSNCDYVTLIIRIVRCEVFTSF